VPESSAPKLFSDALGKEPLEERRVGNVALLLQELELVVDQDFGQANRDGPQGGSELGEKRVAFRSVWVCVESDARASPLLRVAALVGAGLPARRCAGVTPPRPKIYKGPTHKMWNRADPALFRTVGVVLLSWPWPRSWPRASGRVGTAHGFPVVAVVAMGGAHPCYGSYLSGEVVRDGSDPFLSNALGAGLRLCQAGQPGSVRRNRTGPL